MDGVYRYANAKMKVQTKKETEHVRDAVERKAHKRLLIELTKSRCTFRSRVAIITYSTHARINRRRPSRTAVGVKAFTKTVSPYQINPNLKHK